MPKRAFVVLAVALATTTPPLVAASIADGQAIAGTCRIIAAAPFLYSLVIPQSSVECDSPQSRLRVVTVLTRDGIEAAGARRDCRNSAVCYLTVDAAAPDADGSQVWCTQTSGYVNSRFIGEASACETEDF